MSDLDDLDALADALDGLNNGAAREARLDAPAVTTGADGAASSKLDGWLRLLAERRGSDLLLVAGEPPTIRINGVLHRSASAPLDGAEIEDLVVPVLPPHAQKQFREQGIADASRKLAGAGRFRINLHRERGRGAAVIRALPRRVPALSSLDLPAGTEALARLPRGLVLIGGATGSGKSTTLAAIVDDINRREAKHIITVEDPIEFEHTNQKSIIQQIEIGIDAPDFPTALRSALRQAPDVLVVGEMRDAETMKIAMAAGETGHLVLSTLHTSDTASTIARIADSFPAERQNTIRQEIAAALSAVFVQTLVPRIAGGRVPAAELLMVSYGARAHIRRNALQHLHQEITLTRKNGSLSLEECLARLVKTGVIDKAEALGRAVHPDDFEHALKS
ncbi:MAG: PilT/PilU family type 4a pilus ATPase [Acidobacteriota bacterium]